MSPSASNPSGQSNTESGQLSKHADTELRPRTANGTASNDGGSLLVIDIGTSSVRGSIVRPDSSVTDSFRVPTLPSSPDTGLVEFDAKELANAVLLVASQALHSGGPVSGVGIANQRASTVVWERLTGLPLAPGIGWQDLRTVVACLTLQSEGLRLMPNQSATKLAAIIDAVDPSRQRSKNGELCFGTLDSWAAWTLANGLSGVGADGINLDSQTNLHIIDATNAAVTGLVSSDPIQWDNSVLEILNIPVEILPEIVDSSGYLGCANALVGAPPICGILGDQQASMVGQGCTISGYTKATFGTGAMMDQCTGKRVGEAERNPQGTFPIVGWQRQDTPNWGIEAVMLSAGSCIEWLRDDLEILKSSVESYEVASLCDDTGDVWFIPALMGLGTPVWDFGARGTLLGMTRGTRRPEIVRAVLEGIAHRGCDLLEAIEDTTHLEVSTLRVDGGMSANPIFLQALSDAIGRPVEVSKELEATTLGAGYMAGLATKTWKDELELAASFTPRLTFEPNLADSDRSKLRERWLYARERAERTVVELSGIEF